MRVIDLAQIRRVLDDIDLEQEIAAGFVAYSRGEAVVPPVGELVMEDPPGDVHIKYGYLTRGESYVIKVASGFYDNPKRGLPSSNGLMLVFDQQTGRPTAILLDEGYLTDLRTAAAGAVAARHLAPHPVERIGVLGTGIQARLQVDHLRPVTECRKLLAWGRSDASLDLYRREVGTLGFEVETTRDAGEVVAACDLIVHHHPRHGAAPEGGADSPRYPPDGRRVRYRREAGARRRHFGTGGSSGGRQLVSMPGPRGDCPRSALGRDHGGLGGRARRRDRRRCFRQIFEGGDHRRRSDRRGGSGHPDRDRGGPGAPAFRVFVIELAASR